MEAEYKPIDCSFYDRLEAAATLRKVVDLQFYHDDQPQHVKATIETLTLRNKVEYMILSDGSEIRLDKIYALDGIELNKHC